MSVYSTFVKIYCTVVCPLLVQTGSVVAKNATYDVSVLTAASNLVFA